MFNRRLFLSTTLLGIASLFAGAQQPAQIPSQQSEQAFTDWARKLAIPLQTASPTDDSQDITPVGGIIGDARIVELGEATHGTSEFFQLKDRMVRYLATQKGFTIFSIEANMPEAYRLNDFVLHGNGDPKALLKGMYFWTWNTQEVLDMILWMRQYNLSGKGNIEFTGFDMQTPTLSLDTVRQFVGNYDPDYVPALNAAYNDVGKSSPQAFGVATAQIPVSAAAGHRVQLSGFIKTENIEDGFAGLWMRADGPQGTPVAFENMQDHGAKGTIGWTRYEIAINVPANARVVYFGTLHSGSGTAWFDSLEIQIDGKPYSNPSAFDTDFESSTPHGFHVAGQGYQVQIDSKNAHTGRQSLKIERLESGNDSPTIEESQRLQLCRGILDDLESRRGKYNQAGASTKEIEWAIQNARLVVQYEELKVVGQGTRDRAMAENIEWIANQNPSAKIIIWAHNAHIGYQPYSGETQSMGGYLKRYFGPQIVNFGLFFDQGSFRAFDLQAKKMNNFTVGSSPAGTWEKALASTGIPLFALDLRRASFAPETSAWMQEQHRTHSLGAVYDESQAENYWYPSQLQNEFDAIFFVEKTTASHGLP